MPPPIDNGALGRGQVAGQPVELPLVDDAPAPQCAGAFVLEFLDRVADLADQLVADLRVGEHIVGRDAGLAGVHQLDPGDPLGRDVDVGVRGDDHRALAAELERYRGQVGGRALVDLAADLGAAGEHHPVKSLRDEFLADRTVALHNGDRVVVHVALDQFLHQT